MRKHIASIAIAIYLAWGFVCGEALAHYIPAMNQAGVAYYAVTWPWMFCSGMFGRTGTVAKLGFPDPPIPTWAFTFD